MTDKEKLDKLVAEIERLYHQSLVDENRQAEWGLSSAACTSYGKSKVCKELLSFTDSMQKEPKECMYSKDNYTDEDRKALCEDCKEKCAYAIAGVISTNVQIKKEPVSEDLEEAIGKYCSNPDNFISYVDTGFAYRSEQKDDIPLIIKAIKFGANWQKQKDESKVLTEEQYKKDYE